MQPCQTMLRRPNRAGRSGASELRHRGVAPPSRCVMKCSRLRGTNDADAICDMAMQWLREHYSEHRFYLERDVVWTVQSRLQALIDEHRIGLRVFNDHPLLPGRRRARSADLALVEADGSVDLALEFKYEPDHRRDDILEAKLPVVSWGKEGVAKDISRIREMIETGSAAVARSYFIDEGGHFRRRAPHPGSEWVHWSGDTWALVARASRGRPDRF